MNIDFLDELPKISINSKKEEPKYYDDSIENLSIPDERENLKKRDISYDKEFVEKQDFEEKTKINFIEKNIIKIDSQNETDVPKFLSISEPIIIDEISRNEFLFINVVRTAVLTLLISILLLLFFC
jgi:transposase